MKKNVIISVFLLIFGALGVQAKHYSDVPHGYWAIWQIDRVTDAGIMSGVSNDLFMPKRYVTRAEYAAGIIKSIKQENIQLQNAYAFDDINNKHWAWKYITRAIELDIIKPVSDRSFAPNDYVTRADMITFLVNILKSEKITKKEALAAIQNTYLDYDDIPDWFKVTAGKAEVLGVIAKEPPREQYLDCDNYVTRAQFAYFMDALRQKIESYIQERHKAEMSPKTVEEGGIVINSISFYDDVVTLEAKTILPIIISGQIKSGKTQAGEMFQAKFADNIIDDEKHLLLSKKTVLIGRILESSKSIPFIKNGSIMFELSAVNKDGNLTRIYALADCVPPATESHKITKAAAAVYKGKNFVGKDGQILYVKLYKPLRVNIVTGDILD